MQLECKHIDFRYPGTEKIIFNQLTFGFSQAGFHAIFGPSGVGKTSLAGIITGRILANGGHVHTKGINKILYSYNLERLPGWSSVGHHLHRITPAHKISQRDELIDVFELSPLLNRRFSQLSMGQQNRVNLLRYLVQDFELLIMDECLANVDEKTRGRILFAIKQMFPHLIFVMISHNVVEVAKFCREIWVLRDTNKSPQAILVQGQDCISDKPLDHNALQKSMLEIMNAA